MKTKLFTFVIGLFTALAVLTGCSFSDTHDRVEVTFKNFNQEVLYFNSIEYGGDAVYQGPTPTRPDNGEVAYIFSGWDKSLRDIKKDTTFIAQYNVTRSTILIVWSNDDGSILETSKVEYGGMPQYNGTTPTKESDEKYNYIFSGWDKQITEATENTTYTAQYTKTLRKFTVTWKNWDGSTIKTDRNIEYGTLPVYTGNTPTRQSTSEYTYEFEGWIPEITEVTRDTTYTAKYSSTVQTYTITWKNYDGEILSVDDDVPYGTTPVYRGPTPTKPSNNEHKYVFNGWSPTITKVTGNATYTAQFKESSQSYTITWKNYDGSVLKVDQDVEFGSTPRYTGPTPVKPPSERYTYVFTGWTPEIKPVEGNATYTAVFTQGSQQYTITWANYDGSVLKTDQFEYGEMPVYTGDTPKRQSNSTYSYVFAGWTPAVDYVKGDATYTATYTQSENVYTIYFELSGGSSTSYVKSKTVKTLSATDFFFNVTKENYTFRGWEYNGKKVFDEKGNLVSMPAMAPSMTFYAIFSNKINMVVEMNLPGAGKTTGQGEYPYNSNVSLSVTANEGYIFIGWYYGTVLLSEQTQYTFRMWDSDVTLTAKFTYKSYTLRIFANKTDLGLVSLNTANSYVESASTSVTYLNTKTISAYSKTTTRFLGWYDENNKLVDTNAVYTFVMPNKNYTLEAKWNRFNITYVMNGGTNNSSNPATFTYETGTITLKTPTRAGYDFKGWKMDNQTVTTIDSKIIKDITLTATWQAHEYTVSYVLNGGTNNSNNPTKYTVEATKDLYYPTKTGYTFAGWYLDSSFTNPIYEITAATYYKDLTLYAKWTANKYTVILYNPNVTYSGSYTVTFYSYGSTVYTSQVVSTSTALSYPNSIPTRDGYAFKGWYADSDCTTPFDFTAPIAKNTSVYAGWELMVSSSYYSRTYTNPIYYNSSSYCYSSSQYGSASAQTYYYFAALKTGTKTLYYRNGSSSSSYQIMISIYDVTAHMTLVSEKAVTNTSYSALSISAQAGHVYYISTYRYNSSYTPTFYFYFSGFSYPTAGGKVNEHVYTTQTVTYNSTYVLDANVKRNGYTFDGWYDASGNQYTDKDGNCINKWTNTGTITLYPKWVLNTYSIEYHLDGGTNDENNPDSYTVEDNITLKDPSKEGYEFGGWFTNSGLTNQVTTIANANYYANLDLYAKWTPKTYNITLALKDENLPDKYTISFVTNVDGVTVNPVELKYGDKLTYPSAITKSGYAFRGWFEDEECTKLFDFSKQVTKDVTVYAGWQEMVTSNYYNRYYIDATNYTSSSYYYSSSQSSTNSSSRNFYYFTAYKTQSISFYYRTSSSSSYYRIYYAIYDATTGSLVAGTYSTTSTSYSSMSVSLTAGHSYYVTTYRGNTSYSPTAYFYFYGIEKPAAGGMNEYNSETGQIGSTTVTYGQDATIPLPNYTKEGYKFVGWYDEDGNQITDETGALLVPWNVAADTTLYAHWELIE